MDQNTDVDTVWSLNDQKLIISTKKTFNDLRDATTDQYFSLTLKGTTKDLSRVGQVRIKSGGVRSTNGQYLDGNGDLKSGGDYIARFVIVG